MSRRAANDIDKSLKAAFDDLASQQVPDRFVELLTKLRAAEEEAAKQRSSDEDARDA